VLHGLLLAPGIQTNNFGVTLATQSGRVYQLQYKHLLTDDHWTSLPLAAGTGKYLNLTDSTATNSSRFYRVQKW
jgi:hypothetical protein